MKKTKEINKVAKKNSLVAKAEKEQKERLPTITKKEKEARKTIQEVATKIQDPQSTWEQIATYASKLAFFFFFLNQKLRMWLRPWQGPLSPTQGRP